MDASTPPKVIMDLAPSLQSPGFRLVDAGELYALLVSILGLVGGLTALGTNQATGIPLAPGVSVITAGAAGTGAVLPVGLPGQTKTVVNTGTNAALIYGNGGDQIIPLASVTPGASLSVPAGDTAVLVCVSRTFNPNVSTWKVVSMG